MASPTIVHAILTAALVILLGYAGVIAILNLTTSNELLIKEEAQSIANYVAVIISDLRGVVRYAKLNTLVIRLVKMPVPSELKQTYTLQLVNDEDGVLSVVVTPVEKPEERYGVKVAGEIYTLDYALNNDIISEATANRIYNSLSDYGLRLTNQALSSQTLYLWMYRALEDGNEVIVVGWGVRT